MSDDFPAPVAPGELPFPAFAQRLLHRDDPPAPPVVLFDAASVQTRLRVALRRRVGQREPRRLRVLAQLCYNFLDTPRQLTATPELCAQVDRTPGALADAWLELRRAGLVEREHQGRQRVCFLTRAGEDWLLAVVKGETPPPPAANQAE